MPGPLTWRDTAIPNLDGAADSLRFGMQSLNSAFDAGKGLIADIQKQREAGTSSRVLAELAKYQSNPNGLIQDLATGSFQGRFKPEELTPEIMRTVMSKPAELLKFAGDKSAFDQSQLEIADSNYLRDNRDVFNGYLLANRQGPEAVAAYEQEHGDVLKRASSSALRSFITNGQEITDGDLRARGTRLNQLVSGTNFTNEQDDRETGFVTQEIKTALARLDPSQRLAFMNNPDTQKALVAQYGDKATRAISRVVGELDGSFQAPSWMSALGGAGGATTGYDNFLVALESGGKANAANPNSSATGLHQFTDGTWLETVKQAKPAWANGLSDAQLLAARTDPAKSTEMEKVFRANNAAALQSAGAALTNENLYAAHHFGAGGGVKFAKAAGNTPISQILTPDQIAANPYLKGMTKDQVISNWYQRAGTGRTQQVANSTVTQANINQDPQTQLIRDFAAASQSNGNAEELAAQLTGKGGTLEGEDRGSVSAYITSIMSKHKLSAPEAAAVLARSTNGRDSAIRGFFSQNMPWGDGVRTYIDDKKIDEYAKFFKDRGALAKKAVSLDTQQQSIAAGAAANEQVAALQAARQQMIASAAARGGVVDTSMIDAAIAQATGNQGATHAFNAQIATAGDPNSPAPKAAAPAKKADTAKGAKVTKALDTVSKAPTVHDINRNLDAVRAAATRRHNAGEKGLPPIRLMALDNNFNRTVTEAINTAIASGLPQFKPKPGESGAAQRERVKKLLKLY